MKDLGESTKSLLYRGWRFLARTLPDERRRDLPGWGYLESFVWGWLQTPAEHRAAFLQGYAGQETVYTKNLRRAGGIKAAFRLVVGKQRLEPEILANFETPENPDPSLDTIAAGVIQAGQFVGLPKDLVQ